MDGWMDGWMDRWMGGWMDRWIDGWMDRETVIQGGHEREQLMVTVLFVSHHHWAE